MCFSKPPASRCVSLFSLLLAMAQDKRFPFFCQAQTSSGEKNRYYFKNSNLAFETEMQNSPQKKLYFLSDPMRTEKYGVVKRQDNFHPTFSKHFCIVSACVCACVSAVSLLLHHELRPCLPELFLHVEAQTETRQR